MLRTLEWMPSAPTTRSYDPVRPSLSSTPTSVGRSTIDVIVVPSRIGVPRAAEQDVVQVAPVERHRRGDVTPQTGLVEVDELAAGVVEQPASSDHGGGRLHLVAEAKLAEHAQPVARDVDAGAGDGPVHGALDQLCLEPARPQRARQREARDARADDEDPRPHDQPPSHSAARSRGGSPGNPSAVNGWSGRAAGGLSL
jgi:hypothetical protein